MKFFVIFSLLISSTTFAQNEDLVVITRVNGEKAYVGPGPGCFGGAGKAKELSIPGKFHVAFYSEYGCKGKIIFDSYDSLILDNPFEFVSVEIYNDI
ncbi:hypothetical protein K502DRAFT_366632 [Neoconidiobolus thromboides FSU 785]|nr:hypothetical protein K502DRAFT_366632 [Neoconidiobolus thromboides FSU 785]